MSLIKQDTYKRIIELEKDRLDCVIKGADYQASKDFITGVRNACDIILEELEAKNVKNSK